MPRYHVTHRDKLASIIEHGLAPTATGISQRNYDQYSIVTDGVYLTGTISQAEYFRRYNLATELGCNWRELIILRVTDLDESLVHPDPEQVMIELANEVEQLTCDAEHEADAGALVLLGVMDADDAANDESDGSEVWRAYLALDDAQRQPVREWLGLRMNCVHLGTISPDRIEIVADELLSEDEWNDMVSESYHDDTDAYTQHYLFEPLMCDLAA